jgi:hypothetical protein
MYRCADDTVAAFHNTSTSFDDFVHTTGACVGSSVESALAIRVYVRTVRIESPTPSAPMYLPSARTYLPFRHTPRPTA